MPGSFSVDELIKALYGDVGEENEGEFFTAYELAQRWGVGVDRARWILRKAKEGGWTVTVRRVLRESLDGRMLPVPAYRVTREEDAQE